MVYIFVPCTVTDAVEPEVTSSSELELPAHEAVQPGKPNGNLTPFLVLKKCDSPKVEVSSSTEDVDVVFTTAPNHSPGGLPGGLPVSANNNADMYQDSSAVLECAEPSKASVNSNEKMVEEDDDDVVVIEHDTSLNAPSAAEDKDKSLDVTNISDMSSSQPSNVSLL